MFHRTRAVRLPLTSVFGHTRRQLSSSSPVAFTTAAVRCEAAEEDAGVRAMRESVKALCSKFPGEYWRAKEKTSTYPTEFVQALMDAGYLSLLIPEEYGGSEMTIVEACAVMEEIQRSGCNGGAAHAQMYTMGTLLRFGSEQQKKDVLPGIASGALRLQAFGVTEPTSGTDTMSLATSAVLDGPTGDYVINGT
jgi:acyl-CoA dehydrogenase